MIVPSCSNLQLLNVPVYGLAMREIVMGILEDDNIRQVALDHRLPLPTRVLDTWLQKKVHKITPLVSAARETGHDARRLEQFITAFSELDAASIDTPEAWDQFVHQFITIRPGDDWRELLHFDHVLSLFGFDVAAAAALRSVTVSEEAAGEQRGTGNQQTLEQTSLRWLSKFLCAYGPKGCFGDVVNLAFAVLSVASEGHTEASTCDVLKRFGMLLRRASYEGRTAFDGLWIPTHLVHDAESDDIMTLAILQYMHEVSGTELQVLVQLPSEPTFDPLAEKFTTGPGASNCQVYRDAQSRNGAAIASHFELSAVSG